MTEPLIDIFVDYPEGLPTATSQHGKIVGFGPKCPRCGKPKILTLAQGDAMKKAKQIHALRFSPHKLLEHLDGPLSAYVQLAFPFRSTENKHDRTRGWSWHTQRPDTDNLLKVFFDAIAPLFFNDDSQVCKIEAEKIRAAVPGIGLQIQRLDYGDDAELF